MIIYRQAAVDAINALHDMPNAWLDCAVDAVMELPPAQPKIIHCGDCRYWKNNHLCECLSKYGTFETEIYFYCGFAERRTNG